MPKEVGPTHYQVCCHTVCLKAVSYSKAAGNDACAERLPLVLEWVAVLLIESSGCTHKPQCVSPWGPIWDRL
jgi:hypothetical protein